MNDYTTDPQTIVDFWREAGPESWFKKDEAFDETIRHRFGDIYEKAVQGELDEWQEDPTGALALIIVLDQFPRNMFRGTAKAFAGDAKALTLARRALARGDHDTVAEDVNAFLAMPLMHSEDRNDQEACIEWMRRFGDEANQKAAIEHRDIIARFGRFPHRNAIFDRASTPEEKAFLDDGGFNG